MLKSLKVKDYALIESVEVEFSAGLNIITGETGAGKSILIDALGLLLGERASSEVIRTGAGKAIVEGIFDLSSNRKIVNLLNKNDLDNSDELIMRREISSKGANRCFINDSPVSLSLLKEFGELLVDLHGQHEHQSLLRTETHIDFLDEISNLEEELNLYKESFGKLQKLQSELRELRNKESLLNEKREIYEFQIKEIDAVAPQLNEDEELLNELNILENSERLMELTASVYGQLYDSENSVTDILGNIKAEIEELLEIDKTFGEVSGEIDSIIALVNDISSFIRNYKDKIDIEPTRLEELRTRLVSINRLKKKYGGTVEAVISHREKIGKEFDIAGNFDAHILSLEKEIKVTAEKAGELAMTCSAKRKASARKAEKEIVEALKYLGIEKASFIIGISSENSVADNNYVIYNREKIKADNRGIDNVEFFISTNTGEKEKPLAKVASGGEISRIMLALKGILAKSDKLPLLIFDEIDTGVSGRIAQKTGKALKRLSIFHQIISITHLPQIAALADQHYVVEKTDAGERVKSLIRKLSDEERVVEVAKLMSGEDITESSLSGARELMNKN
jgi:DNA repair protein RecN (Recombination protein N)